MADDDPAGPWCDDFNQHAAIQAHAFCERHQLAWCRLCEGACGACRRERQLGEPDAADDDDGDGL